MQIQRVVVPRYIISNAYSYYKYKYCSLNWLSVFSAKTADYYFWMRDAAQNRKYSAYAGIDRPAEYTRESLIHMYMPPRACSSRKYFHWYRELNRVFCRVPIIWILIKKKNRRDSNVSKELIQPFCFSCFYQTARVCEKEWTTW